jgi:hypothetical protein
MKTIRTAKLGDMELRLVEKDNQFIGLVFAGGPAKLRVDGSSAEDVWRRLHDEAGKANPRYFGFDGARARFLQFFPNGFQSDGFTGEERDYKVAAKQKLDATVPLGQATTGEGFGEAVLAVSSAPPIYFLRSRKHASRMCSAGPRPTRSSRRPRASR